MILIYFIKILFQKNIKIVYIFSQILNILHQKINYFDIIKNMPLSLPFVRLLISY